MNKGLEANTTLSHYRIVSKIGAGGMGEVYLAEDTRLDRKVAVKFLNEEFSRDSDKLKRFIQEAKAASALNHPNILTVYEIGTGEGRNYIATEFIEGKTLREHLSADESISLSAILKIGVQVAEALSAAHQAGIIHRDIKPENIMIRSDGYAKVLDFGLAKLTEKKKSERFSSEDETKAFVQTSPGMVMGTVSYMSPEQARGKETDARTDIWSLGVVLYEILAGKVPFAGETVNHTIVSILEKESLLLENVPDELQRIVRKALTKDREMRYQTARDLLIDLKNLRRNLDIQGELERSVIPNRETKPSSAAENETQIYAQKSIEQTKAEAKQTQNITTSSSLEYAVTQAKSHKFVTAICGLILLGAISAVAYFGFFANRSSKQIESIAVLPFVNASGNQEIEFLSDGIAETLINNFTRIPALRVTARSTAFRYKGKDAEPQTIGKELNVGAILTGRVAQRGDTLSVQVDLINVEDGTQIWGNGYNGKASEILDIQQRIGRDVSEQLKMKLSGEQQQQIAKNYTENAEAYQFYLKGRFYWNRRTGENLKKAIAEFQAAADLDPNYALAYVGLADSYAQLEQYAGTPTSETMPKAKAFVERALQIDEQLAEAHTSLGLINDRSWQFAEAEKNFRRAIELKPNYPTSHHWYSILLRERGQYDESLKEIKRAQELDPLSGVINVNVVGVYLRKGDIAAAVETGKKAVELDPNYWQIHSWLGLAYLAQANHAEALAETQKGVELSARTNESLSFLGYAKAVAGKRDEALSIVKELEERHAKREALGQNIAAIYAGLGEKDAAFRWLEKDFEARSGSLPSIAWYPTFEHLRGDSRYADLLRRMDLRQ